MAKHPKTRAHRRFHRARCISNRRNLQWVQCKEKFIKEWGSASERDALLGRLWGVASKTGKVCSCFVCGNPRRFGGGSAWSVLTNQEKKADCVLNDWKSEGFTEY